MHPITLLAEIAAYGLDLDLEDGELYLIGNVQFLPASLRSEIRENLDAIRDLCKSRVNA